MTSDDTKVASFLAAAELRARGKRVWAHTINLRGLMVDETKTFDERRDALVDILNASTWVKNQDEFSELAGLIEKMGDAETAEQFDHIWDLIYDEAYVARVRIQR
jgi:hypothetical protein